VKIAGLVSSAQHKFTKTGKPYGTFIIEDFSGTFRLSLFNSHYVENKNFLEKGFRLFITGNVKTRYNNENEFEFRINNIKLLDEMNVSALAIKLKIEQINSDLVSKMSDFFEKHKGESKLKFLIYDPETKVWIQLASRNTLVDVDNEVLNFLDNENLVYKLF
jgi:DNA polymerase-3 subunit alpha